MRHLVSKMGRLASILIMWEGYLHRLAHTPLILLAPHCKMSLKSLGFSLASMPYCNEAVVTSDVRTVYVMRGPLLMLIIDKLNASLP